MARQKATDKQDVKLGINDVSDDVSDALVTLQSIQHGISIKELLACVETIKAGCGDAHVEVNHDDYWGSGSDITWSRKETDDEVVKRIEKNKKRKKTVAATQKKAAAKKIVDEKAELARLQAKYSDES